MGVNRFTIKRLVDKFTGTGNVADRPRRPRRRVTTQAQDHFIVTSHLRDKKLPSCKTSRRVVGRHGRNISSRTVCRRLKQLRGMAARCPYAGKFG